MTQLNSNHYFSGIITNTRTINWPLLSPITIIFLSLTYLSFVYFVGPQFMKNRKPYSLKRFIQCYNIFQIFANFWLVVNALKYCSPFFVVWRYCESFDEVYGRNCEKQLGVLWWIYFVRMIDLTETVVFVLRKKNNQISFLHTHHHLSTVIWFWSVLRYFNHSHSLTIGALNSFLHIILYSYYFLTTLELNMQRKLLPYKHWVTFMQMGHLVLLMAISMQGFIPSCGDTIVKQFTVVTNVVLGGNVSFFINFYNSLKKSKKT